MEGNNIGLITDQGANECSKKKHPFLKKKKKQQEDFPYKAKQIFGLEDKKDDKK